jgi:glycosyltransferase involved in cell wall biosynthesis
VVAYARGGARETVVPGRSGLLVESSTAEAFADAIETLARQPIPPADARQAAERFSVARFEAGFAAALTETLAGPC